MDLFRARMNCSICLQERTPARARVFIVVGEDQGDPAVIGYCARHAGAAVTRLRAVEGGPRPGNAPYARKAVAALRPHA